MKPKKKFLKQAEKVAFDLEHRRKIKFNMGKYDAAVEKGMQRFADFEAARDYVSDVKTDAINNLGEYLEQFVENFEKNGGEVIFASNKSEALLEIGRIMQKESVKKVVKSKSMTTEEIGLNEYLESSGVEVLETDLGEFIVQQAGEKPYHIVTPAMHKSKKDVAELYHKKFGLPEDASVEEITAYTRQYLRKQFVSADMGITGANFLVADLGAIAVTENEGNALMSVSFPRVHVAIVGIEKVIPSYKDLGVIWQVLANRGTGQHITVYSNLIFGPKKDNEADGPEKMYLILLDNGRSNLLQEPEHKAALKCIRCGACLNACPIYRNIGGYTYDAVYSGPIGSVLMPFYGGLEQYGHLAFACTLCRKCEEVCPARIPLPDLLLDLRNRYVESGQSSLAERLSMKAFAFAGKHPKIFDFGNPWIKNLFATLFVTRLWDKRRAFPKFKKPFKKIYRN